MRVAIRGFQSEGSSHRVPVPGFSHKVAVIGLHS